MHKRVEVGDLDGEGRGLESKARDHLKPTRAPEEPWSRMYTDHWGPTQDRHHSLVDNDDHTRHTEEAEVKGTRAEDDIQAFPEVFSRHGIPRRHHNDNGAAVSGKDSHMPRKYLTNKGNEHVTKKGAEDPEAIGLVEAYRQYDREGQGLDVQGQDNASYRFSSFRT